MRNKRTALKQMNKTISISSRESQVDFLRQNNEELIRQLKLTKEKLEATEARVSVIENEKTLEENESADASRENIELRKKNSTLCDAMAELLQTKIKCDEQATAIKALENQTEEKEIQLKAALERENRRRRLAKRKKIKQLGLNVIKECRNRKMREEA